MTGLFDKSELLGPVLKNRFMMAPMTRSFSPNGLPGTNVAKYYERRASGGVGLIITEGIGISRSGSLNAKDVPVLTAMTVSAWEKVVTAVHQHHCPILAQLWHVGARPNEVTGSDPNGKPDSPSGIAWPGKYVGTAMTEDDIADTIAAYGTAAELAMDAGFDGVEIHAAHGYLIDQFFWHKTNLRTDRWGGSTIGERSLFGSAVIAEVKRRIGPDKILSVRISIDKSKDGTEKIARTKSEVSQWLLKLKEAGASVLHCSGRRWWEPVIDDSDLPFSSLAKSLTGLPTIAVGSVGLELPNDPANYDHHIKPIAIDDLEMHIARGEFDFVAVGRALISDPAWVDKIKCYDQSIMRGFDPSSLAALY